MNMRWIGAALAACLLSTPSLTAQDPSEAVKKILEKVSEEMTEIDRLLRETSQRANDSSRSSGSQRSSAAESAKDLVEETQDSQSRVVRGIDELVDQLQQMMQQNQSSSSSQSQGQPQEGDPQSQGQQPGQRPQQRQEIETPEMLEQGQQQGQEQQQQQQQGEEPRGGQENPDGGQQRDARKGPPEDALEQATRSSSGVFEAELPPYARFLHRRGGAPKVPDKYRRLQNAWLKKTAKQK